MTASAKAFRSLYAIESLFVSAHGERETRGLGEAADPVGWLVKPYTAGSFLDAVDKATVRLGSFEAADRNGETAAR